MASEFPMLLITEILSRLPVKSLVRFRCVSKPWNSLIKDPIFIKLHLKHSILTHTNQTLIIRDSYHHSLAFPALTSLARIDHPLDLDGTGTELLGSCNGLLCLSNGDIFGKDDTIFYNPAIRRHHVLPVCEIVFPKNDGFGCCDRTVYGFGYDCVNDDYKLVRVIQFFSDDEDDVDSEVKVYSLKSGSWTRVCDFPREYYLSYKRGWGFYVNGCLHWVVTWKPVTDGTRLVLSFDLASGEYKIVPQPKYSGGEFHLNVGVLKGCLYVLCNYVDVKSEVWVMEEYGVENSWSKLFSIVQGGVIGSFEYVRPLGLSEDGSRVLVERDGKCLFWFDVETQKVKYVNVDGLPCVMDAEVMVESLVHLECSESKLKRIRKKIKRKQKKNNSKQKKAEVVQKRDDDMSDFLAKGFKLKL